MTRYGLALVAATAVMAGGTALAAPAALEAGGGRTPLCRPLASRPLPPVQGRKRHCVIDIGSRNVKLVVASTQGSDPRSLQDERQCQTRLQLGEKTFDAGARAGRPLGPADRDLLAGVVAAYVAQCTHDGGQVTGTLATEWARRTTNVADIRRTVMARAGVEMEVVDGDREGRYGYHSATRGARGKLVLDFGSRSVQLSYWPLGTAAPSALALPLGIDEAGDRFFGKAQYSDFRSARDAFLAAVRAGAGRFLAQVREDLRRARLTAEIYSLSENGDVPLAVAGKLWDASGRHPVSEEAYGAAVKAAQVKRDPTFGVVTAVMPVKSLEALSARLEGDQALFDQLRSVSVGRVFGYKMLAFPALLTMLAHDLGVKTVVLVPQEMADGLIVDRMTPRSLAGR
jgi:hypothetical protein